MESEQLAQLCREFADDKKAENIVVLDLRGISSIADFFVIASGGSDPHLRAIMNEIEGELIRRHKIKAQRVDGDHHSGWVVLDYIDVIVHVMREDLRSTFDLEGLWGDAPVLPPPSKS
ncbi:MAG: ribosome silencing factor [Verrucomicrobiae bacterium]|jgi:ribosome-associated protein|nr:ribosome silencing factor [Verrucomicrobiae bacterium]